MKAATLIGLSIVFLISCGAESPRETTPPPRVAIDRAAPDVELDPEIARIFGDPPLTGYLPTSLTWAPDSSAIAYIRPLPEREDSPTSELWLHQIKGHRERPLVVGPDLTVSEFCWAGSSALIVVAGGDLYKIELTTGQSAQLTETEPEESSVRASPDGSRIAFVREHDLHLLDLRNGSRQRLTEGGTVQATRGEVTWVYGEEFKTVDGFGWSPDGKRLWFYATDLSQVPFRTVIEDANWSVRLQPYPRPGESNPLVKVGLLDLSRPPRRQTASPVWLDSGPDDDVYLPRVVWHPDSRQLALLRLDRLQTLLELLLCDVVTGSCQPVLEERDPRWVNLLDDPLFINKGAEFLWLSESSGYAHIHRYDIQGKQLGQVTSGQWVVRGIGGVDEKAGWVYFSGSPENPTANRVLRAPLAGGDAELLPGKRGCHVPIFSPDSKFFVDTHSSLKRPPRVEICSQAGKPVASLAAEARRRYKSPPVTTDVFPIETAPGITVWAMLTRPRALDNSQRYPVLVYVYGGPHAQVVLDRFQRQIQPWRNLLASRGILVFSVDGRGSAGRGRRFETAIHRELGTVELEDQLGAVEYLKKQPYTDAERLLIFGWSYGGTMVLNALLRTEGVFRAGVAVAPVTDWRRYDTAYTERYMQRPQDNPEGYERAALTKLADRLEVPLLLVQGLADDNVHLDNSATFIEALVNAGKQFEMMVYPGQAHGIRGARERAHLFTRITRFIEENISFP